MSRRAATLIVASVLILILGVVGAVVPVPYVALRPGPTSNTLGNLGSKPLIEITGHKTYPVDGHLNFTTVAYQGGPENRIDLLTALRGWLDPDVAIVPEETIFPKNESPQKVEQENTQDMTNSQESATAAALHELNIPVSRTVAIQSTTKGLPAYGLLKAGDAILEIDGKKMTSGTDVTNAINAHKPGDKVKFTVKRGSETVKVEVGTVVSPAKTGDKAGKPVVGVLLVEQHFTFPFSVKINVGDVGGPSAGLMFSLGIYDKLTPDNITGGKFIAGTGTITPEGQVGPIGGIQQKMVAARGAGATAFLTPAGNCSDAASAAPKGLRLIKVTTMHDAIQSLTALRAGQTTNLPTCPK